MAFSEDFLCTLHDLNDSISALSKIDLDKLPVEDLMAFVMQMVEFEKAAKNLDQEIRNVVVRATVFGLYKED